MNLKKYYYALQHLITLDQLHEVLSCSTLSVIGLVFVFSGQLCLTECSEHCEIKGYAILLTK